MSLMSRRALLIVNTKSRSGEEGCEAAKQSLAASGITPIHVECGAREELSPVIKDHADKVDLLLNEGSIVPDSPTNHNLETSESPEQDRVQKKVLCIPGRDLLGEAFALILAQLVSRHGVGAKAEQSGILSTARLSALETKDVQLICLCFLGNASKAQIHYAARRLRRRLPDTAIVISLVGDTDHSAEDLSSPDIHSIQYTVTETLEEILKTVRSVEHPPLHKSTEARSLTARDPVAAAKIEAGDRSKTKGPRH